MSEEIIHDVVLTETKKIAVTFGTGLPLGTAATFKHDGVMWIAYPAAKNARILGVIDRMLGQFSRISSEMIRWVHRWPDDAERVVRVIQMTDAMLILKRELINEKGEAETE